MDELLSRYVSGLRRWAQGRLPRWARDLADTHDLVQDALFQTFKKIDGFEHRGAGALHAYLRQAVMNRIRDETRRAGRLPEQAFLHDMKDEGASPLEAAVGAEMLERYEQALASLSMDDRELVVARVGLGLTYDRSSRGRRQTDRGRGRMAVARALLRLAAAMEPR